MNPRFIDIKTLEEAKAAIRKIGCDPRGIEIMAPKAISKVIEMENITMQDALIIKQDMLSIGGDVAIPRSAFELKDEKGTILIMGNIKQLRELVRKLDRHYSRIKEISREISLLLDKNVY
jgi:dihydropteroate synthase